MMHILIVGGTGFLGRALVLRLRRDSHDITVLSRSVDKAASVLGSEATVMSTASTQDQIDDLVSSSDAIINLAGEPVVGRRWSAEQKARILNSRIDTTDRMVESIKRSSNRPRVLLNASAVGYYGASEEEVFTEASPPGTTFLPDVCRQWEEHALVAETLGVRVAIPRIGVVLGREDGAFDKLVAPFKFGVGARLGSGSQHIPWIHVDDLVELMLTALIDDRYRGPFNATAPVSTTMGDLMRQAGAKLRRPVVPVPGVLLETILGQQASVLLDSQKVKPELAIERDFKFTFETIDAALDDLLACDSVDISRLKNPVKSNSAYLSKNAPAFQLQTETVLYRGLDEVFAFFSKSENLGLLTPPKMQMESTSTPGLMGDGAEFSYKLKIEGVPLTWRTRIEQWVEGSRFVDSQIKGPYKCWWHEHTFEAIDADSTRMTDTVLYTPPAGVLGRLMNSIFIAAELKKVFGYRAAIMRLRFGR